MNNNQHSFLHTIFFCLALFTFIFSYQQSYAAERFTSKPSVKEFIRHMEKKYRYNGSYISYVLGRAHYDPSVIQHMERPYEEEPWYHYRNIFITPERVQAGIEFYKQQRKVIAMEERHFGVPGSIIVAIIGIESKYGNRMGSYRVVDSLATLAFNYHPRAQFFRKELEDFFLLVREKDLDPLQIYGSYAGAMGMPQFMPSSYLYYGYGFSNERRPNLFNNGSDAIFSIGNYLMQMGWERHKPIATPAKVSGTRYEQALRNVHDKPKPPQYSVEQLEDLGIKPLGYYDLNDSAYLMAFETDNGVRYWLGFNNFYVITRYNQSNLYAMAVYQLAQYIQDGWRKYQAEKEAKTEKQMTQENE